MRQWGGIITAFAGLLGTVLAFWQWWGAPKGNLRASISVNQFLLPPNTSEDLVEALKLRLAEDVRNALQDPKAMDARMRIGHYKNDMPSLDDIYTKNILSDMMLSCMVQVVVENTGDAPSRNIVLRLPEKEKEILIKKEDGAYASIENERNIKLGELRKAEKLLYGIGIIVHT
ncbi:hypothetical protein XACN24_11585 [Xanthomonas albilineans]|uniref:Uncharacterized protein n=1 Tax=Xanthomonas albilineans (strain GPE PC73 / CFBP 7063) TaxID=380358 RepID=D2U9B4_XANAP|nr:hypothetical protein [Xanthomonas albilineans]CBA16856.1 hypothetical protein XALC_2376 [Xanthomonas albilineans GPE PC73]